VECDGTPVGTLQMPSLTQTGIKVVFQGPLEVTGPQKVWMVDFNVAESFGREAGNSGRWVMSPVIHGADFTFTGTVNLTVELDDGVEQPVGVTFEDYGATLDGDGGPLAADGTKSFEFVFPGDHSLDVTPPAGFTITTEPVLPLDISLASEEVLSQTVTITAIDPVP
ncbi:MAG: DUF4382 domain-containing protein, partial [Gemmatimonadota bacterium]|nr:DUF4382 domain-containing protein [Gemmatimonadota bacterium]